SASAGLDDHAAIVGFAVAAVTAAGRQSRVVDLQGEGAGSLVGCAAVLMSGGDPFALLAALRESGADAWLQAAHRRGVPIVGQSAGAMVCGPSLEPARITSPFAAPDRLDLCGLGLTDRLVLPHHGRPGRAAAHRRAAAACAATVALMPLWDDEALLVDDAGGWMLARASALGPVRTRIARAADAAAVADVFAAASHEAWAPFLGAERLAGQVHDVAAWAQRIAAGGDGFLVTDDDRGVAAFLLVRVLPEGVGEVDLLYTHPRASGAGLGRRLLERSTFDLWCAGLQQAVLWTEHRNERALHIYRRNGWVLDGGVDERAYLGVAIRNLRHRIDLARHAGGD
ncbi:MAG: GNAT family N-acetyltransferase, partial [Pseudomonadales bacterium]